jgi:hypothetical protein
MNKQEIETKLNNVLKRLGMDIPGSEEVLYFRQKIELLADSKNYNKLLRALFSSNDLYGFNSYVFEVQFAYDFQSKNQSLIYEVKQLSNINSSIDYCYNLDNQNTIFFELRLLMQRNWITESIKSQLDNNNFYAIELNGEDEKKETERLQNTILSKCQDAEGKPVKFREPVEGNYNFIVINITELQMGGIDKFDCILAMYGDKHVPEFCRRGIFGMWQELQQTDSSNEEKLYQKFQYFRKTIHGVLFVRQERKCGYLGNIYLGWELEYFPILNNNIISRDKYNFIYTKLGLLQQKWSR